MTAKMHHVLTRGLLLALALFFHSAAAQAFAIQEVKSPGGITAWLVEEKAVPLIAMTFGVRTGSISDPPGKEGAADFLSAMLDEGAGGMLSSEFQAERDALAFRMSFSADKESFTGSFQTLSRNRERSFDLLRLAINQPRFDAEPLERVRQQLVLNARDRAKDPQNRALIAWMKQIVPGDAYDRDSGGSEETIAKLTADELRAAHARIFTRRTLQVAVVGDIDAATLGPLLDKVFGGLPEGEPVPPLPAPRPVAGPSLRVIDVDTPQSLIVFGHDSILRNDPDFIPAYVMTEILGGDGFDSRLTNEVREKRGLTYGVGFGLSPMDRVGFMIGSLQTANETAGQALEVARAEIARMAEEGPTQSELDEAKTYLTGSYPLRFSSNAAIANQLLGLQQQNLGIDYVSKRNSLIEAVTLDQVKAQARRLLHADKLVVTIVGKPQGLK